MLKYLTNLDIQVALATLLNEGKYAKSSIKEALNRLSDCLAIILRILKYNAGNAVVQVYNGTITDDFEEVREMLQNIS
ncbi:MAG: hypothetical protein ACRDBO_13545 [Lachnospiraceae bacterium]